jgi:hypothetical protein
MTPGITPVTSTAANTEDSTELAGIIESRFLEDQVRQ